MKRWVLFGCGFLFLTALGLAQQVVVRSPNGSEHLKKGDTVAIQWGCVQCAGTTELHLVRVPTRPLQSSTAPTREASPEGYQEIGVIRASIPVTPAQQFYSYNWRVGDYYGGTAALGGGYKVLVKIVGTDKTVSDISDTAFVIGAIPTIDYFAINDGLAVTNQRKVTLNYRFTGFPSPGGFRVRCTPTPGTTKDATLAAGTWPTYELPAVPGDYTIELWLMNDLGLGPSKTDTIRYEPSPPPQKDFIVKPSSLICASPPLSIGADWTTYRLISSTRPPEPTAVTCNLLEGTVVIVVSGYPLGNKSEYEFFVGRELNPGWSFVSLAYDGTLCSDQAGYAILTMPQPGSRDILFKVRLWADRMITAGACTFVIKSLVIRGPADRPVSEAFR